MGYDFYKRLSSLKRQADEGLVGRIGFFRAFFASLIPLAVFAFLLGKIFPSEISSRLQAHHAASELDSLDTDSLLDRLDGSAQRKNSRAAHPEELPWIQQTRLILKERVEWLDNALIAAPLSGDLYLTFAESIVSSMFDKEANKAASQPSSALDIGGWVNKIFESLAGGMLRVAFVFCAFWPMWIAGALAGYFGSRPYYIPKRTADFLGVLDRGMGPFFSGLYAPLKPNQGLSGTDLSVPGLATPNRVPLTAARAHPLTAILKRYNAVTETGTELIGVIAAHSDLPGFVEDERCVDESSDPQPEALLEDFPPPPTQGTSGIIHAPATTVDKSSKRGLEGILEAHAALQRYLTQRGDASKGPETNDSFAQHLQLMERIAKEMKSPVAADLLRCLTPSRARTLAQLKPGVVAVAYLATEAGKSLVFKRVGKGFSAVSRYPHLQARAVLHAVVPYHAEFDGDTRLVIRQAILSSRRHGDFGRSFLPTNMPLSSRALRDWLEILYAAPDRAGETSHLVELDAQIEEIHNAFRYEYCQRLRTEQKNGGPSVPGAVGRFWKGIPFKSVVLVPLESVIGLALRQVSDVRQQRIAHLIDQTRHLQALISISARLPGFKRQAMEAESNLSDFDGVAQRLSAHPSGKELIEKWLIVRRMLTKYNWLSTRIGDDAVPVDGLVEGIIVAENDSGNPAVFNYEALTPLRQRRLRELSGPEWERTYYRNSPSASDIEIFIEHEEYLERLKLRQRQEKDGKLQLEAEEGTQTVVSA